MKKSIFILMAVVLLASIGLGRMSTLMATPAVVKNPSSYLIIEWWTFNELKAIETKYDGYVALRQADFDNMKDLLKNWMDYGVYLKTDCDDLTSKIETYKAQVADLNKQIEEIKKSASLSVTEKDNTAQLNKLTEERNSYKAQLEKSVTEKNSLQKQLSDLKANYDELLNSKSNTVSMEEYNDLRNKVSQLEEDNKNAVNDKNLADEEYQKLKKTNSELEDKLAKKEKENLLVLVIFIVVLIITMGAFYLVLKKSRSSTKMS
jgi:chromosome segregation ATPase